MPPKIEDYEFGSIVVNGKRFSSDVIIYPNKVEGSWWRVEGHEVCLEDIKHVLDYNPEVLIIGTGYFGRVNVLQEVTDKLASKGIMLIAKRTKDACKEYNELKDKKKVVAALHLTC
jgi:hypothetical protein